MSCEQGPDTWSLWGRESWGDSFFLRAMTMIYKGSHSMPPWHLQVGNEQGILHILYCPLDYHLAKIIERVFENSRKLEVLWRAKPEKEAIVFFVILLKYSVWIRAQEIWLWFLGVWVIPEATRYNGIWDIWLGPLGLDYFQILSLLQSWTPGGQAKVSRKGGARTIRTCPDGLGQEPKVWPIRQLQNCSDRRVIIVIKFEK